ncbi:MAG: reverse transcriptase family protein, partial [Candidatus Thiodiazotropha sp.]
MVFKTAQQGSTECNKENSGNDIERAPSGGTVSSSFIPATTHTIQPEVALRCLYTNCLSIYNKMSELQQLVHDNTPNLLALSETWLTKEIEDGEINLPGYSVLRSDCTRGRAGGVALYYKQSMPAPLLIDHVDLPFVDQLWVQFPLRGHDAMLLGIIYRSPSSPTGSERALVEGLQQLVCQNKSSHLLLLGDFNIPNVDWQRLRCSTNAGTELIQLVRHFSWTQHVREPTRIRSGQMPSLLDLIFTNEKHQVDLVNHLSPLGFSDHMVLKFDYLCYWTSEVHHNMRLRNFKKADFIGMNSFLQSTIAVLPPDAESACEIIAKSIYDADTLFVPRVDVKRSDKHPLPRSIRRALTLRSRLFAKYRRTDDAVDWENFRVTRNRCKSMIRAHYENVQTRILDAARTDKSVLYRFMRRQRKTKPSTFSLKRPDGTSCSDPTEVAELLKDCYAEILGVMGPQVHPVFPDRLFTDELSNITINVHDVREQLRNLRVYSAMGPDQIHPRILKESADTMAEPFAKLFAYSLESGVVPTSWRSALICPIYKGGDRHSPTNYRPVSLTSIPCKVLERIIKKRILGHLLNNSLLSSSQHGFRPNRSCVTNMLLFMDSLTDAHDKGQITDAIFFDFAKAFDKVPHHMLLYKLNGYGIRGKLLRWIENFLTGRTFRVKVGQFHSSSATIQSGVPQGSVLGPLLFLIYINDLPDAVSSNILLYADDLKIWNACDMSSLQMDVDSVFHWSADWGLPINVEKCAHLSIGGNSGNSFLNNSSGSPQQITSLPRKKELGIWISADMSFSFHHEHTSKKAYAAWNFIKRSFPHISKNNFNFLFGTYIRPLLEYANQAVHSGLVKDINLLEKVQRRATKSVKVLRNMSYEDRLTSLNLYPLDKRRLRGDLIFVFQLFTQHRESEFFTLSDDARLRNNGKKLTKVRPRSFLRQNFFSFRVVNHWNSLPENVVGASSLRQFKTGVDKW